jgi:hypothetical protein
MERKKILVQYEKWIGYPRGIPAAFQKPSRTGGRTFKSKRLFRVHLKHKGEEMRITVAILLFLLGGCAVPENQVGNMIPGRIISLSKGTLLPMQIQLSHGTGKMNATNPATGEYFEGNYTAIQDIKSVQHSKPGFLGDLETHHSIERSTACPASAVLVGNKGTVMQVKMQIQAGNPPVGFGEAEDNKGEKYNVQF